MQKSPSMISKIGVLKITILFVAGLFMTTIPAFAQTVAVRSAVVAANSVVAVPIEISEQVKDILGFQLDLGVTGPEGAAPLRINNIRKGAAVATSPDIDSNPLPPTFEGVRIGLPTEVPALDEPRPDFDGPGAIVEVEFQVPVDAVQGQTYRLNLENVILAGPDNLKIPVTTFGGTLTVGATTALADTIVPPTLAWWKVRMNP